MGKRDIEINIDIYNRFGVLCYIFHTHIIWYYNRNEVQLNIVNTKLKHEWSHSILEIWYFNCVSCIMCLVSFNACLCINPHAPPPGFVFSMLRHLSLRLSNIDALRPEYNYKTSSKRPVLFIRNNKNQFHGWSKA